MTGTTISLLIFVSLLAIWHTVYVRAGRFGFWQLAARIPNEAFDWFAQHEETWIVVHPNDPRVQELQTREDLVGPFLLAVPKVGGTIKVFAQKDGIDTSQEVFMNVFGPSKDTPGTSWPSALALSYPVVAMLSFAQYDAPPTIVLGYGLSNLGYLLLGAGVVAGHFRILGFNYRAPTLIAGGTCWIAGVVLSNL